MTDEQWYKIWKTEGSWIPGALVNSPGVWSIYGGNSGGDGVLSIGQQLQWQSPDFLSAIPTNNCVFTSY